MDGGATVMVMEWCTVVRCIISIIAVAFGVGSGPERVRGWMMGEGSIRGEAIKDSEFTSINSRQTLYVLLLISRHGISNR